nr:trace amine-associated receptor 13c-like [Labrus bergylta]
MSESFGEKAARAQQLLVLLMTETMKEADLCFPQLLNSSCRKPEPPDSSTGLRNIVLYLVSLFTAFLNLLVIISISHFRQLHTPTNLLLLSLAVSDFLVGFLVMPVEVLRTKNCWILGDLMCVLYFLIPMMTVSASIGSMVLISIDRYVAICDPMHYPTKVTLKMATLCVFLCWICSGIYSIILLLDNLKQPGRYISCKGECVVNMLATVDLVVGLIIPITIIIIMYMRVFVVALSQARAMKSQIANVSLKHSKTVKVKKSELKAATTLGILIVVFLMCYCPSYCVLLAGHNILIGSSTETYMVFLMYFNSCLNPTIYALFYPWFRKSIRLIVTLQILQPDSHEANIL